jgi:hypothetical protein
VHGVGVESARVRMCLFIYLEQLICRCYCYVDAGIWARECQGESAEYLETNTWNFMFFVNAESAEYFELYFAGALRILKFYCVEALRKRNKSLESQTKNPL